METAKSSRMNSFVLLAVIVLAGFATAQLYTDRYDNMNVDEILANNRLLIPYMKCALDKGVCTPEGKELKSHLQDAMQTGCSKCTEKQKQIAKKVVKHLKKDTSGDYYKQLVKKYDPEDKYKPIYEAFLASDD